VRGKDNRSRVFLSPRAPKLFRGAPRLEGATAADLLARMGLRPEFSEKTLLKRGNEPPQIYEYYEHYEYYESGIFNRCIVPAGV